jgi:hypothetical protein
VAKKAAEPPLRLGAPKLMNVSPPGAASPVDATG